MRPSSAHPSSLRAQVQDVREERSMPSISPVPERERPGTAAPAASEKGGGGRVPIRHRIRKATAAAKSLYPNSYGWERNGVDLFNRNQTREVERLKMEAQHWKDQLEQLRVPFALYGPSDWTSNSSYPKIARATKELEDLREQLKQLEHSIAEYCTETEGLRINVSEQQTHIFNLRKKRKNINFTRDSHLLTQKQIHVVENRLDTALVQFNAVLKDNKELRERIDTYRRERDVFDGIYQRLEGELQEKKREMAFIIEVSNIAYEERDAAMQELAQLRTFAHDEVGSFKETFKALDQLLEEDRKMKETVRNRIAERERKELELKQELARVEKMNTNNSVILANAAPHSSASVGGGPSHSNTNNNNNNNTPSAASGAGLDLSNLPPRSDVQTIRMYEEAVAKIISATEVPDLSQLMHRFVHSEDSNFSLFNYANELHQEVEVLEAQQVALQEEIAALLDGGDEEQSRRAQLSGYEEALRAAEGRSVRYEQAMRHTENLLHDTMTLIQSLFELLHCDEAIIAKTHGVVELSTETVLEYLAAIEMHVELYLATPSSTSGNGLSERHGGGSSQDALVSWEPAGGAGAAASTSQGGGPLMPYDASLLDIDPRRLPNTGDDGDVSEEEDRIWTHEEMLRRAREKMIRQQQQQQQQQHNNNTGGAGTGVGRSRRKKPLGGGGHGGMNSGELGGSLRR